MMIIQIIITETQTLILMQAIQNIENPKVMKGKGNMQGLWEETYNTLFKTFKEQEIVEGTNDIDFDEHDVEKIDPKNYAMWAMPQTAAIISKWNR